MESEKGEDVVEGERRMERVGRRRRRMKVAGGGRGDSKPPTYVYHRN